MDKTYDYYEPGYSGDDRYYDQLDDEERRLEKEAEEEQAAFDRQIEEEAARKEATGGPKEVGRKTREVISRGKSYGNISGHGPYYEGLGFDDQGRELAIEDMESDFYEIADTMRGISAEFSRLQDAFTRLSADMSSLRPRRRAKAMESLDSSSIQPTKNDIDSDARGGKTGTDDNNE